ncbi:MAG: DUF4294 domain-containing protein [Bacteroidales bacterium]|nr:DUF4294 domain-containing protein [Bacteroidales bacterium]
MKKRISIFFVFCFLFAFMIKAQDYSELTNENVFHIVVIEGDTIYISSIDEVIIFPKPKFNSKRQWRKYYRLIKHIKKVYPLVKAAGEKYDSISAKMMSLSTEKQKRIYIKLAEKEIMEEYEDDIRNLTITQGRILLKLIDREIGETSYDLLKELKSSFTAFFWQTIARIFGQNLKSEFDAEGEDRLINEIMILMENGQL